MAGTPNGTTAPTTTATTATTTTTTPSSWARVRRRTPTEAIELSQQTSTRSTEYRLRMESVQWWQRRLQDAQYQAWKQVLQATIQECHQVLQYQDNDVIDDDEVVTKKLEKADQAFESNIDEMVKESNDINAWWKQFCLPTETISASSSPSLSSISLQQRPYIQYPPEVLPVIIISSPLSSSCLVDRQMLANTFCKEWNHPLDTNNENNNNISLSTIHNDLCLYLPRLLSSLTDTLHLLANVLTTTVQQHSKVYRYPSLLFANTKKRKRRHVHSSIQDWIMEVLQNISLHKNDHHINNDDHRRYPKNLVILLQDDVSGSNVVKQQFLQTLTSWRSLQNISVVLVIIQSHWKVNIEGSLTAMIQSGEDGSGKRYGRRLIYLSVPIQSKTTTTTMSSSSNSLVVDAIALWTQYFLQELQETPIPMLPLDNNPALYQWIQESLLNNPSSCSTMVERLSMIVMNFFSQRGSFVWDSLRSSTTTSTDWKQSSSNPANIFQPNLCVWFCVYENAQALFSIHSSNNTDYHEDHDNDDTTNGSTFDKCHPGLLQCRQYLHYGGKIHYWWNVSCALLPILVWVTERELTKVDGTSAAHTTKKKQVWNPYPIFVLSCLAQAYRFLTAEKVNHDNNDATTVATVDDDDDVTRILSRYLQPNHSRGSNDGLYRMDHHRHDDSTDQPHKGKVLQLVRELIVLVDSASSTSIPTDNESKGKDLEKIRKGLQSMMLDVCCLATHRMQHFTHQWMYVNPFMKWMNLESPPNNTSQIVPRQILPQVRNIRRDVVTGLSPSTQRLYNILQDQISIEEDEWFEAFGGTMEDFYIGLWTLQMIGLIQRKKGVTNKKLAVYEKISVVWC